MRLGTIRKNKRELPVEISNRTCQNVPKKKDKNVSLLSSLHHDSKIHESTEKPEMIVDYNEFNGGIDTLDKICAAYDCARNTQKWSMVSSYSLLNVVR
ncbi:hypothetical protein NQ314_009430 [Rhamnusium bicolor]|uniref:PiggyBac transposable element-derived protein domain-containing protein n=1 Tax=Rhamnusium bicolor TaxID=1586634 RepID=A0AAV8Y1E0_9CUCU|nr:hypothetical protein NQ314_009430 [Rhamnusium bicolor]